MERGASHNCPKAATLALNELTVEQRTRVLRLVREGLSFRTVERITGHRRETISRYVRREKERSRERARAHVRR